MPSRIIHLAVTELLRRGASVERLHQVTEITALFLESIEDDEEFDRVADLFDDEFAQIDYDEGSAE